MRDQFKTPLEIVRGDAGSGLQRDGVVCLPS